MQMAKNGSDILQIKCGLDKESSVIEQGNAEVFTCVGSTFFFSGGFQWHLFANEDDSPFVLHESSRRYDSIAELMSHEEKYLPTGHIVRVGYGYTMKS
ncbi:unnamed protein product [Allacma fusca]|uniref:Uncharacterized protein n=1 Tax=Allacma fusca TaxID=39272 RepID=A0A8J2LJB4_9HEXA|nr:unnamed protein product [Allacma fusca]